MIFFFFFYFWGRVFTWNSTFYLHKLTSLMDIFLLFSSCEDPTRKMIKYLNKVYFYIEIIFPPSHNLKFISPLTSLTFDVLTVNYLKWTFSLPNSFNWWVLLKLFASSWHSHISKRNSLFLVIIPKMSMNIVECDWLINYHCISSALCYLL